MSNTNALVGWGCLYTVEANIVSYWMCYEFWRTVYKYILAVLSKKMTLLNFQVRNPQCVCNN